MHDIDRTQAEYELEFPSNGSELGAEEFEFEAEDSGAASEMVLSEADEMELAAELLEVSDEAELDQFLGGLFKKVTRSLGLPRLPIFKNLGGILKALAKKALPIAGGALGSLIAPGVGTALGGQLASKAGSLFGLELEGLSAEDQEFEVARQFVRLAGEAAKHAAQAAPGAPPAAAARAAVMNAAQQYAPGLLSGGAAGAPSRGTMHSGRWVRRGRKIILYGG